MAFSSLGFILLALMVGQPGWLSLIMSAVLICIYATCFPLDRAGLGVVGKAEASVPSETVQLSVLDAPRGEGIENQKQNQKQNQNAQQNAHELELERVAQFDPENEAEYVVVDKNFGRVFELSSEVGLEDEAEFSEGEELPIQVDSSIAQQSIRSITSEEDCLNVTARVRYPVQADRQIVHIPICPSMDSMPLVESYVISGVDARVRITNTQKFGVRLEVIIAQPTDIEVESIIEVLIRADKKETICQPRQKAA